jgi:hypothetical protein
MADWEPGANRSYPLHLFPALARHPERPANFRWTAVPTSDRDTAVPHIQPRSGHPNYTRRTFWPPIDPHRPFPNRLRLYDAHARSDLRQPSVDRASLTENFPLAKAPLRLLTRHLMKVLPCYPPSFVSKRNQPHHGAVSSPIEHLNPTALHSSRESFYRLINVT